MASSTSSIILLRLLGGKGEGGEIQSYRGRRGQGARRAWEAWGGDEFRKPEGRQWSER
jgi:hypothetical protein